MSLHRMAFFVYLSKLCSISFVKGSSIKDVCTFLPVCNSPSPCVSELNGMSSGCVALKEPKRIIVFFVVALFLKMQGK